MRILCVEPGPAFSVQDVHRGWLRAFRHLGCEAVSVNLGDRIDLYSLAHIHKQGEWVKALTDTDALGMAAKGIETAAFEFWPDVVFITSAFFIPAFTMDLLRARGMKVVLLHTESPYEDDKQVERAAYADLNLINDPTNLDRFREVAPTEYQWHSFDEVVHHPRPAVPSAMSEVAFVGTGFPSRVEFLEKIDWSGIDLALAGHWRNLADSSPLRPFVSHDIDECIDNDDAVTLYTSSQMSFNIYRTESQRPELSIGRSCGPREIELAATGTFFARQRRAESDELFPMLPTFETPAELEEVIRWWLPRSELREECATKARAAVADRTFTNAAKRLLATLAL